MTKSKPFVVFLTLASPPNPGSTSHPVNECASSMAPSLGSKAFSSKPKRIIASCCRSPCCSAPSPFKSTKRASSQSSPPSESYRPPQSSQLGKPYRAQNLLFKRGPLWLSLSVSHAWSVFACPKRNISTSEPSPKL